MVHSGWKEISDYLHCGTRTAQRWENRALPVHRPVRGKRSHVVGVDKGSRAIEACTWRGCLEC